jgi:hypothetical protein
VVPLPGPARVPRPTPRTRYAPRAVFPERPYRATVGHWVACYVLYAGLLFACYRAFWLWYNAIVGLLAALRKAKLLDPEWVAVAYQVGNIVIFFVIFAVAVWAESYLRTSLASTYYLPGRYSLRLARRFIIAALAVAVLPAGAIALYEWTLRNLV